MAASGASLASSPDPTPRAASSHESAAENEKASRIFLADLTTAFAQATPEALPQQLAAAIRLFPDVAARIAAVAVRRIAKDDALAESEKCAAVEQIIVSAIHANRPAAVRITRRTVEAAPAFRNCIVSAATGEMADLRLAFLRAASEGELMRTILARAGGFDGQVSAGGLGVINPANVSATGDQHGPSAVRSPEQPPNNNPPNNNPPNGNPPRGNPPNNPPPYGNNPRPHRLLHQP